MYKGMPFRGVWWFANNVGQTMRTGAAGLFTQWLSETFFLVFVTVSWRRSLLRSAAAGNGRILHARSRKVIKPWWETWEVCVKHELIASVWRSRGWRPCGDVNKWCKPDVRGVSVSQLYLFCSFKLREPHFFADHLLLGETDFLWLC